jgi:hypothetical protein
MKSLCLFVAVLVSLLCSVGCGPLAINAGFPEVPVEQVANSATSTKIGIARVEDSRPNRTAGLIGSVMLLVGPELPDYIERKFRNELAARGITPVDTLAPSKTNKPADHKTIVITVQSASFATPDQLFAAADASVNIAVQLYGISSTNVVFAGSYSGTNRETMGFSRGGGVRSGAILAVAADRAVEAAFADAKFEQALK